MLHRLLSITETLTILENHDYECEAFKGSNGHRQVAAKVWFSQNGNADFNWEIVPFTMPALKSWMGY